jgi:hypothetical protein
MERGVLTTSRTSPLTPPSMPIIYEDIGVDFGFEVLTVMSVEKRSPVYIVV